MTKTLDPITLEVIRNALPAISDEMSVDLQRTSYNMMIYEVRDYCTALLDPDGSLISQNIGGVSHFVADLGVVVKDAVARYGRTGFKPGDVLLHNHQATAGQHLNNVVVYAPIFYEGELVAFAMVRAHWVDVGGLSTGFGAGNRAYDPWSEGLQFNQLKIYEGGVVDQKMLAFIRDNIRFPDNAMGDMRSQLAACRLGERRFVELLDRYGKRRGAGSHPPVLRRDGAEVPRGRREDSGRHVRGRELHRLARQGLRHPRESRSSAAAT